VLTWNVQVNSGGKFRVEVKTSNGLSQAKTITIEDIGNKGGFELDVKGEFAPGKEFTMTAEVRDPLLGQTLTLQVPEGLALAAGNMAQKKVPAAAPGGTSKVGWVVKVAKAGKYSLKVQSSTGVIRGKSITTAQAESGAGHFQLSIAGKLAPGETFTLAAAVTKPIADQQLRLELPAGLERVDGKDTALVPPPAAGDTSAVQWHIKVTAVGKYSVAVHSSTGLIRKKTLTIGSASDKGGFDIVLSGDIKPAGTFTVTARVIDPVAGQKLTLKLPDKLESVESEMTQPVPGSGKTAEVTWKVRVLGAGRLPIRIESSTGLVRTKTITLKQSDGGSGIFGK
jgi:predicted secreted protein